MFFYTYRIARIRVIYISMLLEQTSCSEHTTVETMMKVSISTAKIINVFAVFFGFVEPLGCFMRRVSS